MDTLRKQPTTGPAIAELRQRVALGKGVVWRAADVWIILTG